MKKLKVLFEEFENSKNLTNNNKNLKLLASQHVGPNIVQLFPVHVSVGIKTASNLDPTSKKGCTHGIIHVHEIAMSRLQKIKGRK